MPADVLEANLRALVGRAYEPVRPSAAFVAVLLALVLAAFFGGSA